MVSNFPTSTWSGFRAGSYIHAGGDKPENYRVSNIGKGLGFLFFHHLNHYLTGERGKTLTPGLPGYDPAQEFLFTKGVRIQPNAIFLLLEQHVIYSTFFSAK